MGISLVGGRYVGPIGYSNFMQNNSGLNDRISSLQNQISALQATPSFGFGASGLMPQNLPIDPFNQGIYGLSQGQMPQFNPMAISPYLSQFMSPQFNIPQANSMPMSLSATMGVNPVEGIQRAAQSRLMGMLG